MRLLLDPYRPEEAATCDSAPTARAAPRPGCRENELAGDAAVQLAVGLLEPGSKHDRTQRDGKVACSKAAGWLAQQRDVWEWRLDQRDEHLTIG